MDVDEESLIEDMGTCRLLARLEKADGSNFTRDVESLGIHFTETCTLLQI